MRRATISHDAGASVCKAVASVAAGVAVRRSPIACEALIDERKKLERELAELRKQLAMGGGRTDGGENVVTVGDTKYYSIKVEGLGKNQLLALADQAKINVGSALWQLPMTAPDGKASIVVGVTSDLTSRFNAIELVRVGSAALGGKGGGGRPDMAQAGGPDGGKADDALAAIKQAVALA